MKSNSFVYFSKIKYLSTSMISRGLLISLVVTGVSTACIFLYFKSRLGAVEKKVDLMFDFIQDHEQRQMNTQQDNIEVSFNNSTNSTNSTNNLEEEEEVDISTLEETNLIQISENEDSEDDSESDDSEEDSDGDDANNDVVSGEEIVLETPEQLEKKTIKIEANLNELNEVEDVKIEEADTINLQKTDDLDSLDELSDVDEDELDQEDQEEEEEEEEVTVEEEKQINYNKLTMNVLKEVAEKKGLAGYKSLKKAALINLNEHN